ncbi:MAG: hypothetical protein GX666_12070 [Tissierellia bacterium]|nr:hypothetical protein [Tissierellia bacterium]
MNEYFEMILMLLAVVTTVVVIFLIPYYKSRTTKEQRQAHREQVETYAKNLEIFLVQVDNLVRALEQQIKSTKAGSIKFEEVRTRLTKRYEDLIAELGLTQTEIDDFIEAVVFDMNQHKNDIEKALEE